MSSNHHAESDESGVVRRFRHSRRPDLAISAIAESQGGVVSLDQLLAVRLTEDEVRHRVALGWLRRIHRGVFAVGYRPLTREGRWWAAILAVGDDAVLSHRSAAALFGLLPDDTSDVHVIVPAIQRRPHRGVKPHRHRLHEDERTVWRGIPVTTALRTILDLAHTVPPTELERAIRQAEYEHLVTVPALVAAVEDMTGRRGVRKLRKVLGRVTEAPGVTRSKLETRFVNFLRRHALPMPKLNAPVRLGTQWFEVDCLWANQKVIAELDGRAAHATAAAFETDRARDTALAAAGYRVVRVTWRRLRDDGPTLATELRKILTESDETGAGRPKRHSRRAA